MILVRLQGKSFSITVIQVYAPTTNEKEAEVDQFSEDLEDLLELASKKFCPLLPLNLSGAVSHGSLSCRGKGA